jgi:hypothetical protein
MVKFTTKGGNRMATDFQIPFNAQKKSVYTIQKLCWETLWQYKVSVAMSPCEQQWQ